MPQDNVSEGYSYLFVSIFMMLTFFKEYYPLKDQGVQSTAIYTIYTSSPSLIIIFFIFGSFKLYYIHQPLQPFLRLSEIMSTLIGHPWRLIDSVYMILKLDLSHGYTRQ
jgi:hypothetical protein